MANERERLCKSRVLVVGDIMLDRYWHGSVDRVSPEAPVPVVRMATEETRLGGAGNVARNIVSLGASAVLVGVVGNDDAALQVRHLLEQSGIGDALCSDDSVLTTVKLRINGRAQQLLRVDFEEQPSLNALELMQDRFQRECEHYDALVLSDYGKGGLAFVRRKIARAREVGLPILVDPKGSDYSAYKGATVITPNRQELAQVIGAWADEAELSERVGRLLRDLELQALLLTRSEDGMSLFDREGRVDIPADAREVYDVTGAGDTVIGTLAAMIGAGFTLREALPYANRAGGIVVGKFGTATIDLEELLR